MEVQENKISTITKYRFGVKIKNILKEIPDDIKKFIFIKSSTRDKPDEIYENIFKLIGKKCNIVFSEYYYAGNGVGNVDISNFLQIYIDELEHQIKYNKADYQRRKPKSLQIPVDENLKKSTEEFEIKVSKLSGPSDTLFGEIFRALTYIQYRAHNDGDKPWDIDSPTFTSSLYIISKIDTLNISNYDYQLDINNLKFKDEYLKSLVWDERSIISCEYEHELCDDTQITKYQIVDLLNSNLIKDEPNDFDSRMGKKLITK